MVEFPGIAVLFSRERKKSWYENGILIKKFSRYTYSENSIIPYPNILYLYQGFTIIVCTVCKQKLARKALMDISESVCGRLPAENTLIRRLKAKKVLTEPEANRLQAMTVYEERDAELVDVISKKDADCIFQFINMMQDDSVCCGLHSLFDAYCAHFEKRVNHFLHERCEIGTLILIISAYIGLVS